MSSYLTTIINNGEQREHLITKLREALAGDCRENTHVHNTAFCLVGEGGTGKTAFLNVVASVFAEKGKAVSRLDGKPVRQIKSRNPDGSYKFAADLHTCDEMIMSSSLIKEVVGDMGGCLLMTATKRPEMDPLDHGLRRRVTFVDFENRFVRGARPDSTYDREEACRSLLADLTN